MNGPVNLAQARAISELCADTIGPSAALWPAIPVAEVVHESNSDSAWLEFDKAHEELARRVGHE